MLVQRIAKMGRKDRIMIEINLKTQRADQYLKPRMEVIHLSGEDVVVTSVCPSDSPSGVPWWSGEGD